MPPRIPASVLPPTSLEMAGPSSPSPAHTTGNATANQQRIAREELMSDIMRMRMIVTLGAYVWVGFAALDLLVSSTMGFRHLGYFATIRAIGLVAILLAVMGFRSRRLLTRRTLSLLDITVFAVVDTLITCLCLPYGGISSRYAAGIMVATITRGSVLAAPWRRGLMLLGIPLITYPLTLGVAAMFDTALAAQFRNPQALVSLCLNLFMVLATLVVCVSGGHANWAVRRQLFASRSVGKYHLKRCIGRGGMGEVWIAYHPGLHRDVALKILHPDCDADPVNVRRFEQEVSATSLLTHPNTVRVFDYGVTEDGIWYYAMELLDGETLQALVTREGSLSASRALRIASQIARGLAEAHELGIIHRDVKPENIFITHAGEERDIVKILDFGIAKVNAALCDNSLTRTGAIFGTPAYMSPESAKGHPISPASDVYGVGALLFFMLTGAPPFTADSAAELLLAHAEHKAPELNSKLSLPVIPELEALVHRCLAKAPAERYHDAGKLALEIAELRKRLP